MGTKPPKKLQVERVSSKGVDRFKDQVFLKPVEFSRTRRESRPERPHLKEPLTPLHRLKRFQAIRDRNLRKVTDQKERYPSTKIKMDAKTESSGSVEKEDEIGNMKNKLVEKMNGEPEKESAERNGENFENGVQEDKEEALASPPKRVTRQSEKASTEEALKKVEEALKKKSDDSPKKRGEDSPQKKGEESMKKKEGSPKKVVDEKIVDSNLYEGEKEDGPSRESGTSNKEDFDDEDDYEEEEEEKEPELKILKHSVRIQEATPPPTPQADTPERYQYSRERFLGRISGRRSTRGHLTPFRKRRAADEDEDYERSTGKRRMEAVTPSTSSPGWRYFSTPFKLWSGSTPYRSVQSDSMVVNYDDKTIQEDPDIDVETVIEEEQAAPSVKPSRWICNLM